MNLPLNIGLFGFGVVGQGLYQVLEKTPTLQASISKICIKNATKKRNAPDSLFTTKKEDLLHDDKINVIVEVIDDADAAYEIVATALQNGKHVVSASKKMLAHHLRDLLLLQESSQGSLLYEAAACASIPVIRNLEEYYDNDLLHSMNAIINGSTNYILSKMLEDGLSFETALAQAQHAGFAESEPSLDILGIDAANKWSLILTHAYGIIVSPNELLFHGIQNITEDDAVFATRQHASIKLIAHAAKTNNGNILAYVLPKLVPDVDIMSYVKNEYNGVVIESSFADKQFFYGKGAGSFPTASAVLSDIAALRYNYKYEYKKMKQNNVVRLADEYLLPVYIRYKKDSVINTADWQSFTISGSYNGFLFAQGWVSIAALLKDDWWKQKNISLVVLPDTNDNEKNSFENQASL
jgi:homoserine dehydrogenase